MRLQAEITTDIIPKIAEILKCYTKEDIVVYFSENTISFCIPLNQIGIWIECDISSCFSKYLIKSKQENTIALKVEASQLAQALVFDQSSIRVILSQLDEYVFLQLVHKSLDALKQLEHHVPIIILNQQSVENYAEPDWGKATMMAKLPPIKNLIDWCKKVEKSITKYLTISIIKNSDSGQLDVGIRAENETKMVSVYTLFPDMEPTSSHRKESNISSESYKSAATSELVESEQDIADLEIDNKDDLVECDVTVELKKFVKILKVQHLAPNIALLYIHDKKLLRLHFETQSSKITYVLNGITI